MQTTREMIRDFNIAFERPVNEKLVPLTVSERELLGKLLFEEVIEYLTLGLGLKITDPEGVPLGRNRGGKVESLLNLELDEGVPYDPVESADGLGDVNVVAHFAAHWHGFDLDAVTREIHESNMSKLLGGKPIINGETPGYRDDAHLPDKEETISWNRDFTGERGFDPSKPVGKILKGPNYRPPNLLPILGLSGLMVGGAYCAAEDPES